MKKIIAFCIAIVFSFVVLSPVMAENTSPAPSREAKKTEIKQKVQEKITGNIKERALKEISRRIESLKKLLTRMNEFKKLSESQKATLTTQVQTEIDKLTALQAKLQAETNPETLKTEIQSIITSYRTYGLFIPKIEILGAADRILSVAEEMTTHATKLETKINEQQTNGQDVTELQALLVDMKAKIADAKTQAQNAINSVTPLTPDGYPGNKTTLQQAREMLSVALKDLKTAKADAKKIIVGLLKLGKDNRPKTSITPKLTCIPRPSCLDAKPACRMVDPANRFCPRTTLTPKPTGICPQVLTPARNSQTKACKVFPTACVEKGWVKDTTCNTTTDEDTTNETTEQ